MASSSIATSHSGISHYAGLQGTFWMASGFYSTQSNLPAYLITQGCKEPCAWLAAPIAHNSILGYLIVQCLLQGTLWMASSSYCTQSKFPHISLRRVANNRVDG